MKKTISMGVAILILMGALLFISVSMEATEVSGNQSGVWDATGSPYYITGDVTVPAGQKLEIDASLGPVYVVFNGSYNIFVDGDMYVNGTSLNPVYFMSNQSIQAPNQWRVIAVRDMNGHLEMRNAIISGAASGVVLESDGNMITYTEVYNCTSGIVMNAAHHNRIFNVHSYNNYNYGIWLTSSSQNNTIENCNASFNRVGGIYAELGSDNTTILNTTASYNHGGGVQTGIYVQDSDFATIKNCNVSHNGAGIGLRNSAWGLIENCTAVDNDYSPQIAISLDTASNITIRGCFILSITAPPAETAIYLASSVDNRIENNTMIRCHFAVQMTSYDDRNVIANNTMVGGNYGIKADYYSDNNTLRDNIIENSRYQGIIIETSMDNWVINNTISETMSGSTSAGIMITYYSARNRVVHNNIRDNEGMGVYIPGDGSTDPNNNTIYNNNFFNNSIHAYDNTGKNYWNTTYSQNPLMGGNYWDNYTGTDEFSGPKQDIPGSDLIGDTPYLWISGGSGANDSYPLMEPLGGVPPESSVDAINPYWHNTDISVSATATDIGSGVANVTLFYRVSYDNATWGSWASFGQNETGSWTWTFTFPGGEGYYEFYTVAVDKAGNTEDAPASADARCGYDHTSPTLTINSPAQNALLTDSNVVVDWQGSDAMSGIDYYLVRLDGGIWINVGNSTSYTFASTSDGTHTVDVRATDNAGYINLSAVSFTVDTTPPTLTITSPSEGAMLNAQNVTLSWSASDAGSGIDHYEVRMDGGAWINTDTSTSYVFTVSDANHTVEVKALDSSGKEATDSVNFTVDTTAPTVRITEPEEGSIINTVYNTIIWSGSDETSGIDHYEIRIDGGAWIDMGTSRSYVYEGPFYGNHTAEVRATDRTGNMATTQVNFSIDVIAPEIIRIEPMAGIGMSVNLGTIIVGFSEAMDKNAVHIWLSPEVSGQISWNGSTEVIFTLLSNLSYDTEYTIYVNGTDLAGNPVELNWSYATMSSRGWIAGRVLDENGDPVEGATVRADTGETEITDENGTFVLYVDAGEHTITITKDGYETSTETVNLNPGDHMHISVELSGEKELQEQTFLWIYLLIGLVILGMIVAILLSKKRSSKTEGTPEITGESEEEYPETESEELMEQNDGEPGDIEPEKGPTDEVVE